MLGKFDVNNVIDENGNPTGGSADGVGFSILWQDGPLGRDKERNEPNGAFVETIIAVVKQRLEFFQTASDGRFACHDNAMAIMELSKALMWLNKRTQDREERKVEGTHAK